MSHPVTSKRKALLIYLLVWSLIFLINAAIIHYLQEMPVAIALTDAFVSNMIFAFMGLLAWYPTRYIPFQKSNPVYSLTAHFAAGILVVIVWLIVSMGVLGALNQGNDTYREFLNHSLIWRGILGSMFYLVLVLVFYLTLYGETLKQRAQAEERLRTLVKESELNMLKSQINPHFLFNSLNSISSLTMSSPDEAREMIIRLSDLLRYSLKNRENEFVTLDEEVGHMKDYLAIEQIRFGDKLRYKLDVSDACSQIRVPTMILQPLIENAIKHGVYESVDPVEIVFSCKMHSDYLELKIMNDYDPRQPSRKGTGLGLQNAAQRIQLAYDGNGKLDVRKTDNKFIVTIFTPLKKASKT